MTEEIKPTSENAKAGYLIMRLKPREGVVIGTDVEVRLVSPGNGKEQDAEIAIKAPKEIRIRKVR